MALPILHFFRHACCSPYRSATTHSENSEKFRCGQRGHMTIAIPDVALWQFSFAAYRTSYAVRSAFLTTAIPFLLIDAIIL